MLSLYKADTMLHFWDDRYNEDEFAYGKKANDFLASITFRVPTGKKALCLAEGQGRNAIFLAKAGFDVLAVDQSAAGLQKALELAKEENVEIKIQEADLSSYNIPEESYDCIVSIYGHFDPKTRAYIHRQAVRGLKKGGQFILEAFSKDQLKYDTGGPKALDLLYDLQELEADFDGGLEFQIKRQLNRVVEEGRYHTGMSSVIQIQGTKI